MSLYTQWEELASSQEDEETLQKFWDDYSTTEKNIYTDILENYTVKPNFTIKEFSEKYDTTNELVMGFLDGISTSLINILDLESITDTSAIELEIDFEKLYYNMLEATADYLYTLPQWENILTPEKLQEITKTQKKSKTVVKEVKIGRNDPCSCGSGKKYKKCCGKNA